LNVAYVDAQALRGVDLEVKQGEVFGFLGPNGAGKSTVIRILFDLIRPGGASAAIVGFDAQRQGIQAGAETGYIPGELRLYEGRWDAAGPSGILGSRSPARSVGRVRSPGARVAAELTRAP
jgi:ABC-type Na+ transport system ATPase subunit NatA